MIFGLRTQPSDLNFKLFFPWNLINFSDLVVWASFTRMVAYLYDTPPARRFWFFSGTSKALASEIMV